MIMTYIVIDVDSQLGSYNYILAICILVTRIFKPLKKNQMLQLPAQYNLQVAR